MSYEFILIGHPVAHSVSPAMHNEAYKALGLEAHYQLKDCPSEETVLAQVERIRCGELTGANVTVPWKQVAFDAADEWDQSARKVGVANVLARTRAGKVRAYNTDAIGLATELKRAVRESHTETQGRNAALVIGSGGATRAAVVACQMAGAQRVGVCARRFDPGLAADQWPGAVAFRDLGAELIPWPTFEVDADREPAISSFAQSAHLIVQATSAGMKGTQGGEALSTLMPFATMGSGVAYDLVYNPVVTPFLERAERFGFHAEGGLGMLVGQAAHAIEIWTGSLPERAALMSKAREALGLSNRAQR